MSQKINPISHKLGILQIWNYKFSKYGKTFQNYTKFIQSWNYIWNYLKRFLLKNSLLIDAIDIIQYRNQTLIKIFIHRFRNSSLFENKTLLNTIAVWLKCPVRVEFYQKNNLNNSSFLLVNYITYLFLQKTNSPKKVLQLIYRTLKNQSANPKIVYTIKGMQIVRLKGFKLEFTGCFESSRSQMAKSLKCNFGLVPLTTLNGYVDYSSNTLFTKFGSCGFKLWLFYEFF